ncbi:MAG: hypothetical protein O3A63_20420 [Proteobacteria bacterium]|nr:hypothetical protein [Pseudomonadota bacterium]
MAHSKAIAQYLTRYAEPEANAATRLITRSYRHCLVVPCFDEHPGFLAQLIAHLPDPADLLIILIVNAPSCAADLPLHRTRKLLTELVSASRVLADSGHLTWREMTTGIDLLICNRTTVELLLPRRQGVGLARKIGADMGLALISTGKIELPWIFNTDADAILPHDYLGAINNQTDGTLVYPFTHLSCDEEDLNRRMRAYELHLRYYVDRLAWAGSPYAYHTLGSLIAVHADTYARVRGFPRRNAAEDFYLLNKVAKTAPLITPPHPVVQLQTRWSERVPFGTGPALARDGPQHTYAPASFELLKEVIDYLNALAVDEPRTLSANVKPLAGDLGLLDFCVTAVRQYQPGSSRRIALHSWFDAFRTLRFIHAARSLAADQPVANVMQSLFSGSDEPLESLIRRSHSSVSHGMRSLSA